MLDEVNEKVRSRGGTGEGTAAEDRSRSGSAASRSASVDEGEKISPAPLNIEQQR